MKNSRYSILLMTIAVASASAVCLDPKTGLSGYRKPLSEEVSSTEFIAIGKITKEGPIQGGHDDTDPYINYKVMITRQLKTSLPKVIIVKMELNSGRYVMNVGEEHLLFLTKEKDHFFVSSCGNSSVLPGGNSVLKKVEEQLKQKVKAP